MDDLAPAARVEPAPAPMARLVASLGGRFTGNEPLRLFTTIGRHRRLFRWWLPFAGSLLFRGRLPRADAEVVILRTAWNCDGWYEWVQHVPLAARAGVDQAAIAATAEGPAASCWSHRRRVLVEATDELHAARVISDRTWVRVAAELGTEECIELCFLVGHYEMLAMTLNSLGVEPEASALRKLDASVAAIAGELRERLVRSRAATVAD